MSRLTMSWSKFEGTFQDWIDKYDPYEWELTSRKKVMKGLTYQLWWSSRQGGIWVRVK